jgi:hypothetical protein
MAGDPLSPAFQHVLSVLFVRQFRLVGGTAFQQQLTPLISAAHLMDHRSEPLATVTVDLHSPVIRHNRISTSGCVGRNTRGGHLASNQEDLDSESA